MVEGICQSTHLGVTSLQIDKVANIYRGYYTSAHVLLNLLNDLGKSGKMQGLLSILLLFRNEFNKFNNTGARMLDSIYHMTKLIKNCFFGVKTSRFCHLLRNVIMDVIRFPKNLLTTSGLSILLHRVISLPGTMSCDKYALFFFNKWSKLRIADCSCNSRLFMPV